MPNLSYQERYAIFAEIDDLLARRAITLGEAVRMIRTRLYGMTQTQYARYIKVSDKTLRDVEKGNTDPRLSVIEKLLAPGGFHLTARFVPRRVK